MPAMQPAGRIRTPQARRPDAEEHLEEQLEAEHREINELHTLFADGRSSSVPVGVYVKYALSQENQDKAATARKERQERDRIRDKKAKQLYKATQERRARVRERNGSSVSEMRERNLQSGRLVRACKADWKAERDELKEVLVSESKVKVDTARQNDRRLDAREKAKHEVDRREASQARRERDLAARSFRADLTASNRERAETVRADTSRAVSSSVWGVDQHRRNQAEEKRLGAAQGKLQRQAEEEEWLRKVGAARAAAISTHEKAANAKQEMLRRKREEGEKADRTASIEFSRMKNDLLQSNRQKRLRQFAAHFVSKDRAALFERSPFRRYYQPVQHDVATTPKKVPRDEHAEMRQLLTRGKLASEADSKHDRAAAAKARRDARDAEDAERRQTAGPRGRSKAHETRQIETDPDESEQIIRLVDQVANVEALDIALADGQTEDEALDEYLAQDSNERRTSLETAVLSREAAAIKKCLPFAALWGDDDDRPTASGGWLAGWWGSATKPSQEEARSDQLVESLRAKLANGHLLTGPELAQLEAADSPPPILTDLELALLKAANDLPYGLP